MNLYRQLGLGHRTVMLWAISGRRIFAPQFLQTVSVSIPVLGRTNGAPASVL